MKRIIIADDDFMVRAYLSNLINWEENGYQLAAVVKDGKQALETLDTCDPDLLLTDIEMPLMNGIELLRKIKERAPEKKVVILSCHDDFDYVREAMRLGADEYFLKDEITGEKLLHILQNLLSDTEPGPAVPDEKEENRILLQLLEGKIGSTDIIRPDAAMAIRISGYEDLPAFQSIEKREAFFAQFGRDCRENTEGFADCRCLHVHGSLFACLAEYPKGLSLRQQQELAWNNACRILDTAKRHFEIRAMIGISSAVYGQRETSGRWEKARELLGHSFYEKKPVFCEWQYDDMGSSLPACAEEFLKYAEEWKARRERETLLQACREVLDHFRQEHTKETLVLGWLRNADKIMKVETRNHLTSFAELDGLVQEYAAICANQLSDLEEYSEGVAAVINYIQQNYCYDISLTSAANKVHLAAAYLSYVFHKETGITFSEYLQSCRIAHAKELLEKTDEKVKNVGFLVGYNDNRHFSKIFKKATGMSPQEYRNTFRRR